MKRKSLTVFFILLVLFLLVFSGLYYIYDNTIYLNILMCTPAVSVLSAKLISKEKFNDLYLKPNIKKNVKWYLCAYLVTPFVAYFGAIIYFLIFKNNFDLLGSKFAVEAGIKTQKEYITSLVALLPVAIIVNPIMGIIQCFGEELAWRGFLLPNLNKKFSFRKAVILSSAMWGLWHMPIIAMGYNYGAEHPILGIFAMIILCVVLGIISSFLFYKTKSVWCSVLFHAAINGIDLYAPSTLFMSKMPNPFIGPNLLGIIGGIGFIIAAIILFLKLNGKEPNQNQEGEQNDN